MGKDIELLERTFNASIEVELERIRKNIDQCNKIIENVSNIGFVSVGVIESFKENSKKTINRKYKNKCD